MRAGTMREVISIEEPVETQDATGQVVETWQEFLAQTWADVQPMKGQLPYQAADQLAGRQGLVVELRYVAGVRNNMRVLWFDAECGSTMVLEIITPIWDRKRTRLTLHCALNEADGNRNPKV